MDQVNGKSSPDLQLRRLLRPRAFCQTVCHMSTVRRKPNSRFWFAVFKDGTGRWRQRSTKVRSRALALQMAARLERAYEIRMGRDQFRRNLAEVYQDINGEQIAQTTFRDFVSSVLARKRGEVGPASFKRLQGIADDFLKFLGTAADREITELSTDQIARFRGEIADRSSASNANYYLKQLRHIFSHAVREGLRPDNPALRVGVLKVDKGLGQPHRRPFTTEELQRLLAVVDGEWRGIILTGLYSGQRLGDIAALTWGQLDPSHSFLNIRSQKTKRWCRIPVAPPLKKHFASLIRGENSDPVFPHASRSKIDAQGESRALSAEFHRLLVRAGLAKKRSKANTGRGHCGARKTSPLSFHSLRHTTTSLLKLANVPEAVVRDIIGHESALVSRAYTHLDDASKIAAIEKLPHL